MSKKKIENYPVNGYLIEIYLVPNTNGKKHLDAFYGEILDTATNEKIFSLHRIEILHLKRDLYSIACILSRKYLPDIYVPRFNTIRGAHE